MTCAYAVRGALQKFSGVQKVDVSLNKGLATISLKPGNTVRIADVWDTVRKSGFTPKETKVVGRGDVTPKPEVKITGTNELYVVSPGGANVHEYIGKTITFEGTLQPPKDGKTAPTLTITAMKN